METNIRPERHLWWRGFVVCGIITGLAIFIFSRFGFLDLFQSTRQGIVGEGVLEGIYTCLILMAGGISLIIGGLWVFSQTQNFKFVNHAPLKVKVVMWLVAICGAYFILVVIVALIAAGKSLREG